MTSSSRECRRRCLRRRRGTGRYQVQRHEHIAPTSPPPKFPASLSSLPSMLISMAVCLAIMPRTTQSFSFQPVQRAAISSSSLRLGDGRDIRSCSRRLSSRASVPSSKSSLLASKMENFNEFSLVKEAKSNGPGSNDSSGGVRPIYGPSIAMTDSVTVSKKREGRANPNNQGGDGRTSNGNNPLERRGNRSDDRHAGNRLYSNLSMEELKSLTEYHLEMVNTGHDADGDDNDIRRDMIPLAGAQIHELSRLLASWAKIELLDSQHTKILTRKEKVLAAEMAEKILRKLESVRRWDGDDESNGNGRKRVVTTDMYHLVIKAWAKTGNYNDLLRASSLLDNMELIHSKDNQFLKSSIKCHVSLLDGWCKSRAPGAEIKAEELLMRMEATFSKFHRDSLNYQYYGVNRRGNDGNDNDSDNMRMAHDNRKWKGYNDLDDPSTTTTNAKNSSYDKLRTGNGMDIRHYNNVMNRIATSNKPNAGREAERILQHLIDIYKTHGDESVAPNKSSFNTVIKAYAKSGGKAAARNARRMLSMMENPKLIFVEPVVEGVADNGHVRKRDVDVDFMDGKGDEHKRDKVELRILENIEPDKVSCNSLLLAWANSGDKDGGEKAEQLLERMEEVYKRSGNTAIKPDTLTYNAVIKVWGKCGYKYAGERSELLLNKMLRRYEEGDVDVRPDDVSFNSVIHNLANCHEDDSPRRAMRILERMERAYKSGLVEAKPDIISYNSVLNAFAKSGREGCAQQAEEILDGLEHAFDAGEGDIQPDVYSYNIVINAWANIGETSKAVALLDRMSSRAKRGQTNVKPDVKTYNSVLHAWSQSLDRNAPVKALGLLELMFRLYEGGNENARPDVLSFSTVINAFSKSKFPGKAREVNNLLRRMKKLHEEGHEGMEPNIFVYAAVLNACAYTFGRNEEKEEAFEIGIEVYEEIQEKRIANHVAYGSFLRLARKLIADDLNRRDDLITNTFRQCCLDGQVGEYVLKQLRALPKLYISLLEPYIIDGEVQMQDLPTKWTRNVRDRKRNTQGRRRDYNYTKKYSY
mmetsp:Transcript_8266/g.17621  ORF Transcript_8266/g.17621 Transcript_8266/m.17621 type:complete len:1037 (+) Transcript_8266:113-3223(+)